ncbi:pipsqueak, putative [Anopheles sinensis]|uniref:BTB domain-containing protein n=1 Tax=Anopheles sinensis TaxID=74873 RepID=A0A084VYA9_ANOSI|nr:pipsqueak, putative [Anopheles sinensis]
MGRKIFLVRHGSTMLAEMNRLQRQGLLQDVTLSTEGQQIRLHKLVLSAASPMFRELICKTTSPQPTYTLGIPFHDLRVIVDSLYQPKVEIPVAQLRSVLQSANQMKIRLLVQDTSSRVPVKRPASRMEIGGPSRFGSSRNRSVRVSSSTSPKRPPSRIAINNDAQPGPSGLGGRWNRSMRIGSGISVAEELPNLVTMMQRTCVIEDVPQSVAFVEEKMEVQPDLEIGKAIQPEAEKRTSEEKMDLDVPNPKIARGSPSTKKDVKK